MKKNNILIEDIPDSSDLIKMLKILWNRKNWILLITLFSGLVAGIYSFYAKERWTSSSEVVPNKLYDLGNYLELRKEYARIIGKDINIIELSHQLFNKFDLLLNSTDERSKFFLQSDLYHSLKEAKDVSIDHEVLYDLVETQFSIVKPDPKKEANIINRKISFSADNPEIAKQTLTDLMNYLDTAAYQLELEELLIELRERILDLQYEKSKFEKDLAIQHKVRLSNLSNALETAKLAGIREYLKPIKSRDDSVLLSSDTKIPLTESHISDGSYLFMLGEKYLKAQLDVLLNNDVVYPPRYYQISSMLVELEPLVNKIRNSKGTTIRYQASPTLPVEKDKPNRKLIIILGFILGFVISGTAVLVKDLVRDE